MNSKTAQPIEAEPAEALRGDFARKSRTGAATRPKRICFIDQTGELGGAELCLLDIVSHFKSQCEVILFTDGPLRERIERLGIPVKVMPVPELVLGIKRHASRLNMLLAIPIVLHFAWRLSRELRHCDIVFANTQKALVMGSMASFLARKPLVWYLHDIITAEHFRRSLRMMDVALANYCVSSVITNSEASKEAFLKSGGRNRNLHVVPNGIDPRAFRDAGAEQLSALRAELGLTTAPVVGVFSRLAHWKGQHILLKALHKLPGVQALIVGKPLFSGEYVYANDLQKMSIDLGMADRVRFLGFRDDLSNLMQLSDIVVHTSVDPEPFGRVIVEGMLAGRPVIATRAGGAIEIIDDRQTGVLVEPGDVDELASAIRGILDDPEAAGRLAQAGRAKAMRCFSVNAMVTAIEEAIFSCVESR